MMMMMKIVGNCYFNKINIKCAKIEYFGGVLWRIRKKSKGCTDILPTCMTRSWYTKFVYIYEH